MTDLQLDERAIFNIARRLATLESRQEYLEQVCGGNRHLRERIAELLRSFEEAESFLESPPAAVESPIRDSPTR